MDHTATYQAIIAALDDEIAAITTAGATLTPVRSAVREAFDAATGQAIYRCALDERLFASSDTPLTFDTGERQVAGTLLDLSGMIANIQLEADLGAYLRGGRLRTASTSILQAQRAAFSGLRDGIWQGNEELVAASLDYRSGRIVAPFAADLAARDLNDSQRHAISTALQYNVSFLWGPPGTGKTYTLAHLIAILANEAQRTVLIAAQTNIAVDNLVLALPAVLGATALDDGQVLRVGTPVHPALRAHPGCTEAGRAKQQRDRADRAAQEQTRDRETKNDSATWLALSLVKWRRELATQKNAYLRGLLETKIAEAQARQDALGAPSEAPGDLGATSKPRIVALTLSRLALDGAKWRDRFDVLVVDEASAVAAAAVVLAAAGMRERVVYAGDFVQLPAIALGATPGARAWMARDIFGLAGVNATVAQQATGALATLDTQYRMHPAIAALVNEPFYGGLLHDGVTAAERDLDLPLAAPIAWLDIGEWGPVAVAAPSRSRYNVASAAAIATSIRGWTAEGLSPADIGVIAPYRAQANVIRDALGDGPLAPVLVDTVHRFQGGEREVIVIDLTDTPHLGPGSLLAADEEGVSARLLNVAVTRARRKVVLVTDVADVWHLFPPSAPLWRFHEHLVSAPVLTLPPPPARPFTWSDEASDLVLAPSLILDLPPQVRRHDGSEGETLLVDPHGIWRTTGVPGVGTPVTFLADPDLALGVGRLLHLFSTSNIWPPLFLATLRCRLCRAPVAPLPSLAPGEPSDEEPALTCTSGHPLSRAWLAEKYLFWRDRPRRIVDDGLTENQRIALALARPCPKCGAPLVVRQRREDRSLFLGCSTYPACQHTRSL